MVVFIKTKICTKDADKMENVTYVHWLDYSMILVCTIR